MNNIDFNNTQGSNLGDPKFGQDAVNLRSAKILINNSLSSASGITSNVINATGITAQTASIGLVSTSQINVERLQFIPLDYSPLPTRGLMFFDDFSNRLCIFSGNNAFDLVFLY